jgi:FdhD protein
MARGRTAKVLTRRWDSGELHRRPDQLIVEEPLEVHLEGVLVATTMRTPGDDFELAVGLCHGDGLLAGASVRSCRYCATGSAVDSGFNVVSVDTGGEAPVPAPRLSATSSACGMCGSTGIDDLVRSLRPLPPHDPWPVEVLVGLTEALRGRQELFERTGAVHGAAVFDRAGDVLVTREDIGRHNAVDKVVGRLLLDGRLPARDGGTPGELGLWVSGRGGFEIVQKAWAAGFGAVVSVSAPSSMAVEAARTAGIALVGFVRRDADGQVTANVYSPEP